MIRKKKNVLLLGLCALLILMAAGCSNSAQKDTVRVAMLKGPTGMEIVRLMEQNDAGEAANNYEIELLGAPDQLAPMMISGEVDIAALPVNMAAIVYNRMEGDVSVLGVNTLGILYLLTTEDDVQSIADLAGRTVYSTGQGATPEYTINYILEQNGLVPDEDVQVEYLSEHAELATLMAAGEVTLAVLPEPFVTTVVTQNPEMRIALDLTEEWEKATGGVELTMTCVVVRDEFLSSNKAAVDKFLEEYKASVDYVNNNLEEAGALMEQYEIIGSAAMAQQAIPRCNIVWMDGPGMAGAVDTYMNVLMEANPQSVGGSLPDDDFYYQK